MEKLPDNKIEIVQLPEIASEIQQMAAVDQGMRERHIDEEEFWDEEVDKNNTERMKEIVEEIGWPTVSKVGADASKDAWLLIQHADHDIAFQIMCLGLMKREPQGEVSLHDIAYLEDRIRIHNKTPQVYGTQFDQKDGRFVPREIENEEEVNLRRAEMGLPTLEENIEDMYRRYKVEKPKE
ncbi:hypothetical protein IPJ70_01785 [Candidatus Campbellbacteria bacterium]|nr:MAG: hypothetical protein IPJ70_01785 [Candidatus Campbellbacteria bacterium]